MFFLTKARNFDAEKRSKLKQSKVFHKHWAKTIQQFHMFCKIKNLLGNRATDTEQVSLEKQLQLKINFKILEETDQISSDDTNNLHRAQVKLS